MSTSEDQLKGTWELLEWANLSASGERSYPLGNDATGYISYTADGHVLVQMCAKDRPNYAGSDPFGGSASEDMSALKSQIAYSGRYSVEETDVVHHVTHATFPNWVGSKQRRRFSFEDPDTLILSAEGATFKGQTVTAIVRWARAASHTPTRH